MPQSARLLPPPKDQSSKLGSSITLEASINISQPFSSTARAVGGVFGHVSSVSGTPSSSASAGVSPNTFILSIRTELVGDVFALNANSKT